MISSQMLAFVSNLDTTNFRFRPFFVIKCAEISDEPLFFTHLFLPASRVFSLISAFSIAVILRDFGLSDYILHSFFLLTGMMRHRV